ncbi:MAG: hypothetical protein HY070_08655 [Chloroflexi bacterium]|nr:hypothetical protein [Chloroflexota bacterium]
MATTSLVRGLDQSTFRRVAGGLISGMVYGMWTMMVEAILNAGTNLIAAFFSPVVYIAATVLGGFANPKFFPANQLPPADPIAIVLGLMGHMMNSVIFALIFYAIINRVTTNNARIVAGLVYGVAVFAVMWHGVLPFVDPVMLRVNFLGFLAGHMMYGIGLGVAANWASRA